MLVYVKVIYGLRKKRVARIDSGRRKLLMKSQSASRGVVLSPLY